MNYGQWRRETILEDYGRSSSVGRPDEAAIQRYFRRPCLSEAQSGSCVKSAWASWASSRERMEPVEHHLAHASAAYYTCPWPDEPVLVLTCDGSGDRLCATVSMGERGELTRIAQISEHDSIGRLYAMVTRYLGMAPLEHEYKVMGLAPYVGSRSEDCWRRRSGFGNCSNLPAEP